MDGYKIFISVNCKEVIEEPTSQFRAPRRSFLREPQEHELSGRRSASERQEEQVDYIKEIINVGDDVLRTVTSAIENNDFSNLSTDLKERFGDFADDVKEDAQMRSRGSRARRSTYNRTTYWYDPETGESGVSHRRPKGSSSGSEGRPSDGYGTNGSGGRTGFSSTQTGTYPYKRNQNELTPFRPRFFGRGKAIVKMITGILGMVCFLPATIASLILSLTGDVSYLIALLILLPISAGSGWLIFTGNRRRKLVDVYNRYAEIIGPSEYISMEELATYAGTSEEDAVEKIEKMMKDNMLPQGKFDLNKTTLMLTPGIWKQYQAAEKARQKRELEESRNTPPEAPAEKKSTEKSIIQEGNQFVRKIHRYNDRIPDPDMSEKLFRLENIVQRIFEYVEKNPESASDLHKLMNYYLPTIEKLLDAYVDLDRHPSGSENIERTRKEIEEAVDTVNVAFDNLFNDLFQDTAWDISSDISVMKTMMKQDGLVKESREKEKV